MFDINFFLQSIFLIDVRMIGIGSIVTVLILIMEENISGNYCQYNREGFSDVSFFWGHLIEIHKLFHADNYNMSRSSNSRSSRPKIFIQICAARENGIESALGYALMEIPILNNGTHDIELLTCKPVPKDFINRNLKNLRDYHFGTSRDSFVSMRDYFIRSDNDAKTKFDTETSGVVSLRVINISSSEDERYSPNEVDSQKPVLVETIDEVLSRVRRNRRERRMCSDNISPISDISEEKVEMDIIGRSRTKHVLSKIRARQATRAKELSNRVKIS